MKHKEIIPKNAAIIVHGKRILAALKHSDARVLHTFVWEVPTAIHKHMGKYYGRYNIYRHTIDIDIPTNWHDVDRLVVLYILLHEIAHHKHHTKGGYNFPPFNYLMRAIETQKALFPEEVAANKHAVRAMLKMGIPPSAIDSSPCSAFGPNCFTRVGHKYRRYKWIGHYFRDHKD